MNYGRFLTAVSRARNSEFLSKLVEIQQRASPGSLIALSTGMPNTSCFPLSSAHLYTRKGKKLDLSPLWMNQGLQYTMSQGHPEMVEWGKQLQRRKHNPPTDYLNHEGKMDLCVTAGSQEAICKTMEMLVTQGDNILIETPTYPGLLSIAKPMGCNMLEVETDEHGPKISSLRSILSNWNPTDSADVWSDIPRVFYTVSSGSNPTGVTTSLERKQQVYQVAREYDFLILEDDPYYYIQFTKTPVPSYLSMDVDGRVIRFDSFSKILSAGMRIGFATGPQPLIEKLVYHMQVCTQHANTLSQMICLLILQDWGQEGFDAHMESVTEFYRKRRDIIVESCDTWLKDYAEWTVPDSGMFLWMKLLGIPDTGDLVMQKALDAGVLFAPGNAFHANDATPSPYLRASYSQAPEEDIDKGIQRLAALLKKELKQTASG
ncbi:kynurenine/alpha-aminoadipate aminotransferase, mitochondrial-like isoform X2 [Branchiostoma floridae]|uniref:Kynurenine/alpha-aminoadipate aminotransferase, mitochondrial n=1 Tax=Branchiostoma floridae TaxID=7739 RepID=A0A9J7MW74_BRAFL|nr:kynurenine/alpha-aminoadipate aminotransferase, mitochondrial-like isoform X1 [Branchiostoma floridae]XP_035681121.1 kynurenine/alpha-aminoadipate aminotransferase, mitochondrial-like isoform X2 [Branchiostoma floridae]